MADNLSSFAKLVSLIGDSLEPLTEKRFRTKPHGHRKARNRRLNAVAREQRKLERRNKKNRNLRTPPRERRS